MMTIDRDINRWDNSLDRKKACRYQRNTEIKKIFHEKTARSHGCVRLFIHASSKNLRLIIEEKSDKLRVAGMYRSAIWQHFPRLLKLANRWASLAVRLFIAPIEFEQFIIVPHFIEIISFFSWVFYIYRISSCLSNGDRNWQLLTIIMLTFNWPIDSLYEIIIRWWWYGPLVCCQCGWTLSANVIVCWEWSWSCCSISSSAVIIFCLVLHC